MAGGGRGLWGAARVMSHDTIMVGLEVYDSYLGLVTGRGRVGFHSQARLYIIRGRRE